MKTSLKTLAIGSAMFSMFFGAGNVIFPLAIGHYAQDKTIYAILGLLLTAVAIPFSGLLAMVLFDGDQKKFFGAIGKIPGFLVAFFIITLLGPLGSTPRCIALSYSTIKMAAGPISPIFFNALACLLIYVFTYQKKRILDWLGYVLTPLLLISLAFIILIGLLTSEPSTASEMDSFTVFLHGLKEGYNTMDLLAAFFFSGIILSALKQTHPLDSNSGLMKLALKASAIGAGLLSATYIGFSLVASYHGKSLSIEGVDQLLGAITLKIMGPSAGIWVCITIALACLTTAIALCNCFAEFIRVQIFQNKISYNQALIGTLLLTFMVANWEFEGISQFLGPVLEVCYPFLIVLTGYNLIVGLLERRKSVAVN